MSDEGPQDRRGKQRTPGQRKTPRSPLSPRDILVLILRTYRASFPYILLFVLVMLVVTWLLTELVF